MQSEHSKKLVFLISFIVSFLQIASGVRCYKGLDFDWEGKSDTTAYIAGVKACTVELKLCR
jgi:hypothetical protein